jgi:hypothetical protein
MLAFPPFAALREPPDLYLLDPCPHKEGRRASRVSGAPRADLEMTEYFSEAAKYSSMKWNENTLIIFGVVMGLVIGAVYDEAAGGAYYKFLLGTDGRLQWEILATGIAALVAARWTVAKISDQIKQTERLATDRRRRRERAALAMLPLALSEFANYATACINGLYALRPCFQSDGSLDRSQTGKPLIRIS